MLKTMNIRNITIVLLILLSLQAGCDERAKTNDQNAVQIPAWKPAPKQEEKQAVDLYVDAKMMYDLKEYDDAIKKLDEVTNMSPEFAMAYSLKGDIYKILKNYEKSAESYEIAATLDAYNVKDLLNLGWVYHILEEPGKSAAAYARAAKAEPNNLLANYGAAQGYHKLKDWDNAIMYAEKAADINPNFIGPNILLGDAYEEKKDHISAIKAYRRALEIDIANPEAMVSLAIAYLQTKQYDESVKLLDSAIKIDPDYGTAYQYLGFAHTMLKQKDLALENYLKAVAIDGNDWKARKGLGVIYMLKNTQTGDLVYKAMAIEQWNFSLEANPNQPNLQAVIEKYTKQDQADDE